MKVFSPWVSLQVYTTSIWFRITECLWLYDYSSPCERPINFSLRVSRGSHSDAETRVGDISRYLLGFRIQCDVMVHFQHDFKICGALSCFNHERLMSLFLVCQTMFTLGESRGIFQTTERERQAQDNVSFNKWLGILAGEDLPSKLHCSENGDLKSSASNEEDELV